MGTRTRMRIAFFGLPIAAWLLNCDGHEIALASLCRSGWPGERRLKRVLGEARVLSVPDASDDAFIARVQQLEPDLVVSWFWTKRLPMQLVEAARLGGLNVHPSLLPQYRGPDPTYWAIARGDRTTGVTAHAIAAEYDAGPIYARRAVAINPSWNGWQLARALDGPSLSLLREVVSRFARGETLEAEPQDEVRATQAPALTIEQRAISWSSTTFEIERHVRALAPSPCAWTSIGPELLLVHKVEPLSRYPRMLAPGQAASFEGRAIVRTADGAVALAKCELAPRGRAAPEVADSMSPRVARNSGFVEIDAFEVAALVERAARAPIAAAQRRAGRHRRR